jgi:dihydroxycyclohexadiene carboxylate dehydrogenase
LTGRFEGKSVVVTGAAQGIGRACALRFAKEGARVVVADQVEEVAREVQQQIRSANGDAEIFVGNLEESAPAGELVEFAIARFGRIDVSVHNVGGAMWTKRFCEFSPEEMEIEIRRSLFSTLWCCRAVLPGMIRQQSGSIVNVGSVATRGINRVPYSAAKGGVHALTACIALEVARHGIRVNCVAPGGTDVGARRIPRNRATPTQADREGLAEVVEQTMRDTPLGRLGTAEEQAAAIAFLASDEASYVTGQVFYVAGGAIG